MGYSEYIPNDNYNYLTSCSVSRGTDVAPVSLKLPPIPGIPHLCLPQQPLAGAGAELQSSQPLLLVPHKTRNGYYALNQRAQKKKQLVNCPGRKRLSFRSLFILPPIPAKAGLPRQL